MRSNGSAITFGNIFRIERHSFKVAFEPEETKIAYRVICGCDVVMKPREKDGSDTVINDEGDGAVANDAVGNSTLVGDSSIAEDPELNELLMNAKDVGDGDFEMEPGSNDA